VQLDGSILGVWHGEVATEVAQFEGDGSSVGQVRLGRGRVLDKAVFVAHPPTDIV